MSLQGYGDTPSDGTAWVPKVLQLERHRLQYLLPALPATAGGQAPYWAGLWPAAEAMCKFLEANLHWVKNKRLWEIGAGLGLPSALAGHYALQVVCTDADEEAVKAARRHMHINGVAQRVRCWEFDWHHYRQEPSFDVLLASDIHYDPADFEVLGGHFTRWLKQGKTILLSSPHRLAGRDFLLSLLPAVTASETYEVTGGKAAAEPATVYILQLDTTMQ